MEDIFFVYITASKKVSAYGLSAPERVGDYVQGICTNSGSYKTFRLDRFLQFFGNIETAEEYAARIRCFLLEEPDATEIPLLALQQNQKKYNRYESPSMFKPLDFSGALEICFTGFKKEDKARLIKIASDKGMIVRGDITVNLHFLCGGYNAGPKKLEVARKKGTLILRESEFLTLIETGELPDDYDN
ncbi:BRCT domain-containing protein [Serratia ficaria]|uniref:BRCT domain-containing protein n=1 Tax=Serratia ficaria TaxID=61651 RepID=UPI00217B52BF|nr:BRCT domain-containing protein [Serratia ficaria]CAI0764044.1 Uncharacterised protein [Serratia ficaria]CAI1565645.1 Uncharacterised protein [Serratia ficaria]CAI2404167.1 Uncharacterised protein [Serratia ficaria]CAI2430410.1 Uncharacterised protein [Serratia ficaria]